MARTCGDKNAGTTRPARCASVLIPCSIVRNGDSVISRTRNRTTARPTSGQDSAAGDTLGVARRVFGDRALRAFTARDQSPACTIRIIRDASNRLRESTGAGFRRLRSQAVALALSPLTTCSSGRHPASATDCRSDHRPIAGDPYTFDFLPSGPF